MKRIIKSILMIMVFIPFIVSAETNVITNAKLKKALIDNINYSVDENGDGILSESEVSNFNHDLVLVNLGLNNDDISELSMFTSVTDISLAKNNISDITPLLNLPNLKVLDICGNPYRCSFLNGTEKCDELYDLQATLVSRGGHVAAGGLTIDYDKTKITNSTPKYNVLATILTETDADFTMLQGGAVHIKYKMNETDIKLIKEYLRLYEMFVEKLSNYKIDVNVDIYVDNNKLTHMEPNGSTEHGQETDVFAYDLDELSDIKYDYDSNIVVAYTHYNTHSFSGLADFNKGRGFVFIPYDKMMYNFLSTAISNIGGRSEEEQNALFASVGVNDKDKFFNDLNDWSVNSGDIINQLIAKLRDTEIKKAMEEEINDLKNNVVVNAEVDTFVHEFTHNLESYNIIRGYDNTWEFHEALRLLGEYLPELKNNTDDVTDYEGYYLNGNQNPKNTSEVGIQNEVYETSPTNFFKNGGSAIEETVLDNEVNEDEGKVTLSWSSVPNVTFYKVVREEKDTSIREIIAITEELSFVDTTLNRGVDYVYKVVPVKIEPYNYEGRFDTAETIRSSSNTKNVKIKVLEVTEVPTLTIASNGNSVTLNWNKVDNAKSFIVKRSTSENGNYSTLTEGDIATYTDNNLTYGSTYYYKVIAKNDYNSKESNVVSASIKLVKINNLTLKPANKQVTINYDKADCNGYEIYYSLNNSKWTKLTTITNKNTTSYKHTKLGVNKTYHYKVRCYKTVNSKKLYGAYSDVKTTKTSPKSTSVKVYSKGYNKILLNMTKVGGATKYKTYRSTKKTSGFKKIATSDTTAYNDTTVLPTITYYYKVKACNNYNACSGFSGVVSKKTALKTITNLKRSIGNTNIKLTYASTPGATGYVVYRSTSKTRKYSKIGTSTTTSYNDTKVEPKKVYYYKVRSFMSDNGKKYYSAYSNIVNGKNTIKKVTNLSGSSLEGKADLTYNLINGETGYQIFRSTSKTGKYSSIKKTSENNYSDENVTLGKTYYYKVRAYRVLNGKTYYGPYSDVVTVKVIN